MAVGARGGPVGTPVGGIWQSEDRANLNATQSLGVGQSATSTVDVAASASQSLGISQSANATVAVAATATQSLGIGQSTSATVAVAASASQSLGIGQSANATVDVAATAAQSLGIGQAANAFLTTVRVVTGSQSLGISQDANSALITVRAVTGSQSLGIGQSASVVLIPLPELPITSTDILDLPVNCVLAGQQKIKDRWKEYEYHSPDLAHKGHGARFATSRLSKEKPSFSVTSSRKGY